ncbi:9249_t:CDS:1, partial [Funneliformis geosporum]
LIKYRNITDNFETDGSLEKAITETVETFIDTVITTQEHLKVNDLTKLTTITMPDDKSLENLITFYRENKDKAPVSPNQPQIVEKVIINETSVVNQIIQECDLGLSENSNLTQVIEQINKLTKTKPPVKPIINTPFGESLTKIVEIDLNSLEKELGIFLSSEIKQQIQKVNNYQELSGLRNREIKNYLEKMQGGKITIQPTKKLEMFKVERII